MRHLIRSRQPMFEFMIKRRLAGHDLETVEGRVAALRESAPVVAGIRDQSLSVGYTRNLGKWLGMDPGEVGRAVSAARNATPRPATPEARRDEARRDQQSESQPTPVVEFAITDLPVDQPTRQERDALMAILQYPGDVGRELVERVSRVRFINPTLAVIRDAVATNLDAQSGDEWVATISREVPESFVTLVQQLAVAPIPERADRIPAYCARLARDLIDRDLLQRKVEVLGALQRTDSVQEPEKYRDLQKESLSIETERRKLRDD